MAKRKKGDPRDEAITRALAILMEHAPAAVVLLERTAEEQEAGKKLPLARGEGGSSAEYGLVAMAYERADEIGLTPPEEEGE